MICSHIRGVFMMRTHIRSWRESAALEGTPADATGLHADGWGPIGSLAVPPCPRNEVEQRKCGLSVRLWMLAI